MKRILLPGVILLFLAPCPTLAQDGGLPQVLLDSVVVTATREAVDARLTGRRIVVWTADDLAALPVSSFDELLRTVGGVEVQSRGGFGVQSDLTLRGTTFNGVLVLLDGVRMNDPMTGHFLADFPVPLSEIARVEVLRGPASALYGPDALGGVVQIFTRAALARTGERVDRGMLSVQAGSHGLITAEGAGGVGRNGQLLSAASTYQASDGMPVRNANGQALTSSAGPVRTDFTRQAHTLAYTGGLGATRVYTRVGYDRRDFGAYHFYTPFPSDTAREATSTLWVHGRAQRPLGRGTRAELQLGARQHEDEYVYNPLTPANRHTSRLFTAQAQLSRPVQDRVLFTAGLSAGLRAIRSNNMGAHEDGSWGAFGFGLWQPRDALSFNLGLHLDYDSGYGAELTPQASAAYLVGPLTLRASAGRAVRAPNYVERYINTMLPRPRGRDYGNPGLRPERAWSYEAGFDFRPAPGFMVHATAHRRLVYDLIDYIRLTPADTVFRAQNLLTTRTNGVEVEGHYRLLLARSGVHLQAAYAYLDTELGGLPAGATSKYALTHARHLVQAAGTLSAGVVQLGAQGLWKDRLTGSSYGVLNLRGAYRIGLGGVPVTVGLELRNALDARYSEVFDAPMPGRWWILGLRLGGETPGQG